MPSQTLEELREFHRFLGDKLSGGGVNWSPEEAIDEWRREHPVTAFDDEVMAIREALDDVAAGDRGKPFDEFDREFRKRHNLPNQP